MSAPLTSSHSLAQISHDVLVQPQRKDPTNSKIVKLKESNDKLTDDTGTACKLLHNWDQLHFEDGILYRQTPERGQLALPLDYQSVVLKHLHNNAGHVVTERVHQLAKERFYWP